MEMVEKWVRLLTMVLCDPDDSPFPRDLMPKYLFGETSDNEDSSFRQVAKEVRFRAGKKPHILISGGSDIAGYPGAPKWMDCMERSYRIPREIIEVIPLNGPPNTKTEADALVQYVAEKAWGEFAIVAPPFHQLRCFLTVLGSMKTMGRMDLRVYNWVGVSLPWQEPARHSQGSLKDVRENLIGHEFKRILTYTSKGDLVTVDEALEYLRQRDKQ